MIPLYVENGIAYVWNSEDWYTLRTKFRICGPLIGSAPCFPRQNDFLGLPMALMREEAALLVNVGACELFEIPKITQSLDEQEKLNIQELEKKALDEQIEALRKQRIEQLSQNIDVIYAGKKKKLLSKGETDLKLDKQALLQEEINKLPKLSPSHVLVHLPSEHYIKTEVTKQGLNSLHSDFSDSESFLRFAVFKNLWEQGHFITNGSKFGSDFLVYLGDPVKFHATYMVRCINNYKTCLRPASLVAFGRLAVSVNKLAVLACSNSLGQIEYQTVQWHDSINGFTILPLEELVKMFTSPITLKHCNLMNIMGVWQEVATLLSVKQRIKLFLNNRLFTVVADRLDGPFMRFWQSLHAPVNQTWGVI